MKTQRLALAAAAAHIALSAHAALAENSGFYLSGKGGPSFLNVSGIHSTTGAGGVTDDSDSNLVGGFGMAGGYTWLQQGLPLRTELEFMNRTEVTTNSTPLFTSGATNFGLASTVQNVSLMLKGYWYVPMGDGAKWSPYFTIGGGIARNAVKGDLTPIAAGGVPTHFSKSRLDPAWTFGAGISFYLGNNVVNDVEIHYVDLGGADWGIPGTANLSANAVRGAELIFSLRYNF